MAKQIGLMGARIRALREANDIEAGILAYKAGMSKAHIYRIESGERPNASAVTLGKIAQALNTSIEYFLGLTDDPGRPQFADTGPDVPHPIATRLDRLRELLRDLPADLAGQVTTALEAYVLALRAVYQAGSQAGPTLGRSLVPIDDDDYSFSQLLDAFRRLSPTEQESAIAEMRQMLRRKHHTPGATTDDETTDSFEEEEETAQRGG